MDGTATAYSNWHQGEPNNYNGEDENRAFMNFNWQHFSRGRAQWAMMAHEFLAIVRADALCRDGRGVPVQ